MTTVTWIYIVVMRICRLRPISTHRIDIDDMPEEIRFYYRYNDVCTFELIRPIARGTTSLLSDRCVDFQVIYQSNVTDIYLFEESLD